MGAPGKMDSLGVDLVLWEWIWVNLGVDLGARAVDMDAPELDLRKWMWECSGSRFRCSGTGSGCPVNGRVCAKSFEIGSGSAWSGSGSLRGVHLDALVVDLDSLGGD